jgi:hypothetical protein
MIIINDKDINNMIIPKHWLCLTFITISDGFLIISLKHNNTSNDDITNNNIIDNIFCFLLFAIK